MHMQETCAQPIKDIITGKIRMQEMWAVLIVRDRESISISICVLFHPISTFEQFSLDADLFSPINSCDRYQSSQFSRRRHLAAYSMDERPRFSRPQCAQDWEDRQDFIIELYESKTLKETMRIMEQEHFFKAT